MAQLKTTLKAVKFNSQSLPGYLFDAEVTLFPFLALEAQKQLRDKTIGQIASSQSLSAERIVSLIQQKVGVLESMKV